jgi:hypothetical protein
MILIDLSEIIYSISNFSSFKNKILFNLYQNRFSLLLNKIKIILKKVRILSKLFHKIETTIIKILFIITVWNINFHVV